MFIERFKLLSILMNDERHYLHIKTNYYLLCDDCMRHL